MITCDKCSDTDSNMESFTITFKQQYPISLPEFNRFHIHLCNKCVEEIRNWSDKSFALYFRQDLFCDR